MSFTISKHPILRSAVIFSSRDSFNKSFCVEMLTATNAMHIILFFFRDLVIIWCCFCCDLFFVLLQMYGYPLRRLVKIGPNYIDWKRRTLPTWHIGCILFPSILTSSYCCQPAASLDTSTAPTGLSF